MNTYNRAYPNPNSPGRKRPLPSVKSGVASARPSVGPLPATSGGLASARPPAGPLSAYANAAVNDARYQTASMASLRDAIHQNPIVSTPARDAAIGKQSQQVAAMQAIQQRMAASGNSQLGTAGRFTVNDILPDAAASPYGTSVMPGIVSRGGVTNVVGQLPNMPASVDQAVSDRAAAESIRKQGVAQRVQANNAQQLAKNADTLKEWGRSPKDNFIGGKQYVPGQGYKPISNFQAAQNAMSPEQAQTFDARRTARQAELDLRKQRQFSRAQFREATAGRGAIYDDDGGLNLAGTMAAQAFNRNPVLGVAGAMRLDENDIQRAALMEQGRQFDGTLGLDQQRLDASTDLAGRRLQFDQQRFDAGNDLAVKQFDADNTYRGNELGFREKQFTAQDLLANKELGIRTDQYKSQDELARERLKFDQSRAVTQDSLANQQMTLEEMKAKEMLAKSQFDRSEEAFNRELQLKGLSPEDKFMESLGTAREFATTPEGERQPVIDTAITAIQQNPDKAVEILKATGIDSASLLKALETAQEDESWIWLPDDAELSRRSAKVNSIKALLDAAGIKHE